jgi:PAS domain S-box-containing protein
MDKQRASILPGGILAAWIGALKRKPKRSIAPSLAELGRLSREQQAIRKCSQVLVRAEDERTLLEDICRVVCEVAGYRMAWVGYAENDGSKTVRPAASAGFDEGYLDQARITWAESERGRGPEGSAIRSGESAWVQDFADDPRAAPWREDALLRGYRSGIALPLKDERKKTFGSLNIYSAEPGIFDAGEIQLLEELSRDLAFGIVALRAGAERNLVEERLRESEEKYRTLFEESFDGLYITSPDGKILDMNKKGIELFGYDNLGEIQELDLVRDVYAFPPDRHRILGMVDEKGAAEYEVVVKRRGGGLMTTYCAMTAIRDQRGGISAYRGIIRDITGIKNAEEKLRESENRYRRITECITDYQYSVTVSEGRAMETVQGPGCVTVTGYSPEEFAADPYLWFRIVAPEDRELVQDYVKRILSGRETPPLEHRIIRKDGGMRWICDTTILRKDSSERLLAYDGVIKDITERKEAEKRLQKNLLEKEALLQEVHHRVKNNLNVISSLLNLQSSFIQSPEDAIKAFQYSRDRILAMAFVHQELYQSKDYGRIDIGTYLAPLTKQLAGLYCSDPSIRVESDIGNIALDVSFAVPIGLILNELITNAFKHAFPSGGPGAIRIAFRQDGADFYEFSVSDTGIGISGCGAEPRMGSLGLTLIRLLVQQINGVLSTACDHGTCIKIRFPSKYGTE